MPREVVHDKDALYPTLREGVPFKNAWLEFRKNAPPPVPSPFVLSPTLWLGLVGDAPPQRFFSTIPKRPDTGAKSSSLEEADPPDGPITTGHRAIPSPTDIPIMILAHHPAHQVDDDEDEPWCGTLTDTTPAYISSSALHSSPQPTPFPGKGGKNGGTGLNEATKPTGIPDADVGGMQPDRTLSPGEPPKRAAEPAASSESSETSGDGDLVISTTIYSQIRGTSRRHWEFAFLSSLRILPSAGALTIITPSIQQFTDSGGLPNSAALLGQITWTWSQFTADGFVQLFVIMLPAFFVLLTTLYIALSIQDNHGLDRDDRVTNKQAIPQQTWEGVILLLSGLTGIAVTLTISWLTECAPLLLLLSTGGVVTYGFMITIHTRSLENERACLARSKQQEEALSRTNAEAAETRLRKQGRDRERQEDNWDRKEKKRDRSRASRWVLLHYTRRRLLARHFIVMTLPAILSPVPPA